MKSLGSKLAPATLTVSPTTSRVDGVTVMDGGGGGAMLGSNRMGATAPWPPEDGTATIWQASASAQSVLTPAIRRIRRGT